MIRKSQNSRNQGFSYHFSLAMEGSGSGSESGYVDSKNLRIRIRNTWIESCLTKPMIGTVNLNPLVLHVTLYLKKNIILLDCMQKVKLSEWGNCCIVYKASLAYNKISIFLKKPAKLGLLIWQGIYGGFLPDHSGQHLLPASWGQLCGHLYTSQQSRKTSGGTHRYFENIPAWVFSSIFSKMQCSVNSNDVHFRFFYWNHLVKLSSFGRFMNICYYFMRIETQYTENCIAQCYCKPACLVKACWRTKILKK